MSNNQKNSTFFISDLHLIPSRPQLIQLFLSFLDEISGKADALYILGDLFEFWIGDDMIYKRAGTPYLPIIKKLKALSESGVNLYFQQGNRDFLAQQKFATATGAELLPDQKVINLSGTPTLLMHGDTLCTDDTSYQRMRRIFRIKLIQKLFLSLSPEKRSNIAGNTRKAIKNKAPKKAYNIVDVNQLEVEKVMREAGVLQLIHGHTHRPAVHEFELDGKPAKRIVLSDWIDKACYLKLESGHFVSVINE